MAFFIVAGYGTLRCGHIKRWTKRRGTIHHVPPAITPLWHCNRFIILNQNVHVQSRISIVLISTSLFSHKKFVTYCSPILCFFVWKTLFSTGWKPKSLQPRVTPWEWITLWNMRPARAKALEQIVLCLLLPLQGVHLITRLPRALPWAVSFWAFSPCHSHAVFQ